MLQNPPKKKSTKIIQIVCDAQIGIRGLGDNDRVYKWSTSDSNWYLNGEIDNQIWEELK